MSNKSVKLLKTIMPLKLLNKTIRDNFVVIDPLFPQKNPSAFRNAEINEYLRLVNNFSVYTMYPMKPGHEAWFEHGYGVSYEEFVENKQGYLRYYPENATKLHYLEKNKKYKFNLAYSYFLAETYVLLPFFDKYKIPFTFVLYPGGAFGLNFEKSDNMLKKIFQSSNFKGVIVTQQITRDYLYSKDLCPKDKVSYIYGGFVQFKEKDIKPKKYYKKDKSTFDICFVAAKYSDKGVDKGYDLFIKTAKILSKTTKDIIFHVIGGFSPEDIDISDIKSRIKFYGYQQPAFLLDFYSGMDIFLAPNRPFKLYEGNFDGFPLGIDAGYCGVALFVADELKMNHHYKEDKEIIILTLKPEEIAETVLNSYNNLDSFYELSKKGQKVTNKLFNIDYQISQRLKVFAGFTDLEINKL